MWNPDMRHMQQQKQGWSAARVELTTLASKVTLPEPRRQSTVEQASRSARWSPSCKVAGHCVLLCQGVSDWLDGLGAGSVHPLFRDCTSLRSSN